MINFEENLISQNEKMIYKIASASRKKGYNIEDLYQVGVMGILKASENYNKNSKAKFSTYAYKYIIGEIAKYVREDRNIRVGPEIIKLFNACRKAEEYLSQKYYREPTILEICEFVGINEEELYNCISNCEFTNSLDEQIDDNRTVYETVIVDNQSEIDDKLMLKDELEQLSDFDRKIIDLRVYQDYTQSETAKILGLSQVQISRYENKIYTRMREKMKVS